MKLKTNAELNASPIVANAAMNRERNIQGTNSYSKDLDFDILGFLKPGALHSPSQILGGTQPVKWLDLCCGTGKALIQATNLLLEEGFDQFSITGIDLVSMFDSPPQVPNLRLLEADLSVWTPGDEKFDLITCVHGLHYMGDKLDLIRRAVSWLKPNGVFRANLDIKNLRRGIECSKTIPARVLRRQGFEYNKATHTLSCHGHRDVVFPQFTYLGADDQSGPNYTLQPVVNSHYRHINGKKIKRSKAAKQRRREKRESR